MTAVQSYRPQSTDFEFVPAAAHQEEVSRRPKLSYWQDVWLRLKSNRQAICCLWIVIAMTIFTIAGPWLWRVDPGAQDLNLISRTPNLGTPALLVDAQDRWDNPVASRHPPAPTDDYYASEQPELPAPIDLQMVGTPNTYSVQLRWTPVRNAAGYTIYRNHYRPQAINELGLPLGTTLAGNIVGYEDRLKLRDRTYYYSVTATDGRSESTRFVSLAVPVIQAVSFEQAEDYGLLGAFEGIPNSTLILPAHPLGTDHLGRDMLSRLMHGARVSLFIGILAPLLFVAFGAVYGAFAGFLGGRTDALLMRFADFVVALPFLLFMILFRIAAGTQSGESGIGPILVAFVLLLWPATARLVRGQVLQIRGEGYVQAAQLMGAPAWYLVLRHMLPNTLGVILVTLTFAIPSAIFIEAFLSFIGMGVAPPTPSWGSMSFEGLKTMLTYPHELFFPALFISVTVLAFNLFGDGLRDAVDTKLARTNAEFQQSEPEAEEPPHAALPEVTSEARSSPNQEIADTLLDVRNLAVNFVTHGGIVQAVRGVSFKVRTGTTLAIVGESGCGKSVTALSLLGLVPKPAGYLSSGQAWYQGQDLLSLSGSALNQVRGTKVAMIFQDPMAALNPTMRVGTQIAEALVVHKGASKSAAHARAIELLEQSQIAGAAERARQYSLEYSGGMLQRAMIATALACKPALLIADEPSTSLDVTIQAQILGLMQELQRSQGMAMVLITHDLGVVAKMADDVAVMYAGQIVETGSAEDIFYRPAHPYTMGLKQAMPSSREQQKIPLKPIAGTPPDLYKPPVGCGYFARCPYAMKLCETHSPPAFTLSSATESVPHEARCWLQHPNAPEAVPGMANLPENLQLYRPATRTGFDKQTQDAG